MSTRVAEGVSALELADYQKAVRLVLRHPLITPVYPDRTALATVRRWAQQLRTDLMEVLGYRLITTADTARLRRAQDQLDATRPALSRAGRPFDRRRYAYLALTLAALGRHGAQVALGELADAVAADAVRIEGLGLDTARKHDRDAFVDAATWLTERGALRLADGSATSWALDPVRGRGAVRHRPGGPHRRAPAHPGAAARHLGAGAAGLGGRAEPVRGASGPASLGRPAGPPGGPGEPGRLLRGRRPGVDRPAAGARARRGLVAADRSRRGAAFGGHRPGGHLRPPVRPAFPRRRHGRTGRAAARRPDQRGGGTSWAARPRAAARADGGRTPDGAGRPHRPGASGARGAG